MRKDIYWVCVFKIKPEQFEEFKRVVAPLVAATKQESGALAYEYNISDDRTTVHILEHYRVSDAVVSHVTQTFSSFAERFSALATVASFVGLWRSRTRGAQDIGRLRSYLYDSVRWLHPLSARERLGNDRAVS